MLMRRFIATNWRYSNKGWCNSQRSMLQDKIQHHLIKINKLINQKQSIRYIVPLFFNAIKCIYENCSHCKIDPLLIDQVINKFKIFHQDKFQELNALDQVHTFMVEECIQMLESRHVQARSQLKKSRLMSKLGKEEEPPPEEDCIFIPQETYYFDEYYQNTRQISSSSQPLPSSKKLIRPISMDEVPNFQHSKLQVDKMWDSIQNLYDEHRIDEAYELCQKFQNSLFLCDPNSKLTLEKEDLIEQIHEEYQLMTHYYQFFSQPGYTFDKEQDGVRMYYRIFQEQKEVSIRIQTQLNISIQNFLCIVSEVDLFQQFVPFAYDTRQLKQIARNKKIGMTKVFVPLLSNRQAYFYAAAYDRLKTHNSIFFFSKTISSDPAFQSKLGLHITVDPDLVELQYKFYIMEYIPVGNNRGKIRLATNIDMKMGFLPMFVINKSLRIFAFDYFSNLLEVNRKFEGSKWHKKMLSRPYIYNFFKYRIRDYLQNQRCM